MARPLDPQYALGWVQAHQHTRDAEEKFEVDAKLAATISNTVQVVCWTSVSFRCLFLTTSHVLT